MPKMNKDGSKQCSKCKTVYDTAEGNFYKDGSYRDGYAYACIECMKEYRKEYMKEYHKEYMKSDKYKEYQKTPNRIIRKSISHSIYKNFKTEKTNYYLNCSFTELRKHLQKQFDNKMSFDNYGLHGWHIDHIIPCAAFDLTKKEHQMICFNYNNLQPLWAIDNRKKRNKIDKDLVKKTYKKIIKNLEVTK